MQLYGQNYGSLQALRGINIELMLGDINKELQSTASSQDYANTWIQNNVQNYGDVNFFILFFFFREFQPMTSSLHDSSLSSDQDTNRFLV